MNEPRWLTRDVVIALHGELLAEHGGAAGLTNENALESALARPRQKRHYARSDLAALAAAYAYGLARNHPFADGNKRVALAALDVFLRLNGFALGAPEVETAAVMQDLAAGELEEADLVEWVRQSSRRL